MDDLLRLLELLEESSVAEQVSFPLLEAGIPLRLLFLGVWSLHRMFHLEVQVQSRAV